jgi:uncharacterized membrane protein YoaK (UPF0700 family)
LASGLVVVIAKAGYRGHVVIVFTLGSSIVGGVFVGVLLDVFCFLVSMWPSSTLVKSYL